MSNHTPNHHFIKYLITAGILILLGFLLFDYKKELLLILDISTYQFILISVLILTSIFLNGSKLNKITKNFNIYIPYGPGDYCEGVIPDPIPNSEVKLFSADGTLP